jgi:hypothetical protein
MFRQLCLVAILLISSAPALGQVAVNPDYPEVYVVQRGDTLWDISAVFLRDPWQWPEIWHINTQIANPHLIYPGDVVRLIYVDGQPQLVMDDGSGRYGTQSVTTQQVIKLTPQMTSIPLDEAITSIPMDQIRDFFTSNRVLTEEEIEVAPYMVAGPQERIMIGQADSFYVRGSLVPGVSIYQIFRIGERYRDPETRKYLGYRAEFKGTARFELQSEDVSKFSVTRSNEEILAGDILLPLQQDDLDPILYPKVPDTLIQAQIIAVEGGVSHIGQLDVVALNKGQNAGLDNGHVLAVLDLGERVRDTVNGGRVNLPDERAGMLIVFKSLPTMSFGLILEAEQPLSVGDTVTNP